MKMKLRKYQQECIDNCIEWIKTSVEPAVIEATVSFGKSLVIASLAKKIVDISSKKVLILCPNGTLVKQNAKKVKENGDKVSVFSASVGEKSIRHDIVVGTPQSIKNSLSRFGKQFSAILIDEGEGLTNAVKEICRRIKEENPNCRILGFTGTPYRTNTGYVYRIDIDGTILGENQARDPFYLKCIHKTRTQELMDEGYLTPMVIGEIMSEKYHTSSLHLNSMGKFNSADVDRAYHGQGRITSSIVADIVRQSHGKNGVLIFGATIKHCQEIMDSLPPAMSRMVSSGNPDNEKNIEDFRKQKFKYLVNKDMLLVGADFPHVDVIAVLRKTESRRLMQQLLGRGVRLHEGNWKIEPETARERKQAIAMGIKPFCLYLDYTEDNTEIHYPDGDLWNPIIEASLSVGEKQYIKCLCPDCGTENEYSARKNEADYPVSETGYFQDLQGNDIETEHGPLPAHYGRRCFGMHPAGGGTYKQCSYRYTFKECVHCGLDNDITARHCVSCKGELINPGDALRKEFRALKRSPHNKQTDIVTEYHFNESMTQSGKECYRVNFKTPYRSFTVWIMKSPMNNLQLHQKELWQALKGKPETVTYKKEPSGFYRLFAFNEKEDVLEELTV